MAPRRRTKAVPARRRKVVDETSFVSCSSGAAAVIREEVWVDAKNQTLKYNLAFICHTICQTDNGRVLGYDNAHGFHERHHIGTAREVEFISYEDTLLKFLKEVARIRREG